MIKYFILIGVSSVIYIIYNEIINGSTNTNDVETSNNLKHIAKLKLFRNFFFRLSVVISVCSVTDGGFSAIVLFGSSILLNEMLKRYIEKEKEFLSEAEREFLTKEEIKENEDKVEKIIESTFYSGYESNTESTESNTESKELNTEVKKEREPYIIYDENAEQVIYEEIGIMDEKGRV